MGIFRAEYVFDLFHIWGVRTLRVLGFRATSIQHPGAAGHVGYVESQKMIQREER